MAAILKKKRSWRRKQVFFFLSLRRDFLCHGLPSLGDCFFSEIAQLLFLPFAQGPEPPLPIASFSNTGVQFLRI